MKRFFVSLFLFTLISNFRFPTSIFAVSYPDYQNYVNDFADIYSSDFENILNSDLQSLEKQTGDQIAVATVRSLDGTTIEEYAVKLFEKWGVGQKDQDNGLLLLIAPNERKVKIEVGYGLEGTITDGTAGYVLDHYFLPDIKNGQYEAGTQKTIEVLKNYLSDTSQIPVTSSPQTQNNWPEIIFFLFLTGLPIYFLAYISRTREIITGTITGGVLGFLISGFVLSVMLALFGLFLDLILSRTYRRRKELGLPTDFFRSRGGFGGGFGGSGGGGFGGFGGGSSGGGGASRGW